MGNVVVCDPTKAALITGPRGEKLVTMNNCGFKFWVIDDMVQLDLSLRTITVTADVPTQKGVIVQIESCAQVKVDAFAWNKHAGELRLQKKEIKAAFGKYGGVEVHMSAHEAEKVEEDINNNLRDIVEAIQRGIVCEMTPEQLISDRQMFTDKVEEQAGPLMAANGMQLLSYTIIDVDDPHEIVDLSAAELREALSSKVTYRIKNRLYRTRSFIDISDLERMSPDEMRVEMKKRGLRTTKKEYTTDPYLVVLGDKRIAEVKREAQEGKERNQNAARAVMEKYFSEEDAAVAQFAREAHVVNQKNTELRSESDRNLDMVLEKNEKDISTANAEAESAFDIKQSKLQQQVIKETTKQESIQAELNVMVAEHEATKTQIEKKGTSSAALMEQRNQAEGMRIRAGADGHSVKKIAAAEAVANLARGEADAAVISKRAEAFKKYGDQATVQSVINKLGTVGELISKPLEQTDKNIFISHNGKAGSMMVQDVVRMLEAVPEAIESVTGVEYKKTISNMIAAADAEKEIA